MSITPFSSRIGDVSAALMLIGQSVSKVDDDTLRDALEPDLSFSSKVCLDDIVRPCRTGKWPTDELEELRWVLSETISGYPISKAADPMHSGYASYLALLLLHIETIVGEGPVPLASYCTSIVCRSAFTMSDPTWTYAVLTCLNEVLVLRQAACGASQSFEIGTVLVAIAVLWRLFGAQSVGLRSIVPLDSTVDPPWLWTGDSGEPEISSQRLWREVLSSEAALSADFSAIRGRWGL